MAPLPRPYGPGAGVRPRAPSIDPTPLCATGAREHGRKRRWATTAQEIFAGHPLALAVHAAVRDVVAGFGGVDERVSASQLAFRRRRGFAYLWLPGRYLRRPGADVVLSVVLGHRDGSPRWKEVAHPAPAHWMHHLEVHDLAEIDDEVAGWLREAYDRAG